MFWIVDDRLQEPVPVLSELELFSAFMEDQEHFFSLVLGVLFY